MRSIDHMKTCRECREKQGKRYGQQTDEMADFELLDTLCSDGESIFAQEDILSKLNTLQNTGCFLEAVLVTLLVFEVWRVLSGNAGR